MEMHPAGEIEEHVAVGKCPYLKNSDFGVLNFMTITTAAINVLLLWIMLNPRVSTFVSKNFVNTDELLKQLLIKFVYISCTFYFIYTYSAQDISAAALALLGMVIAFLLACAWNYFIE